MYPPASERKLLARPTILSSEILIVPVDVTWVMRMSTTPTRSATREGDHERRHSGFRDDDRLQEADDRGHRDGREDREPP